MAGEASKPIDSKTLWGGGRSPFSISYGKMMMWFFLISDALTFGGLLVSLGFAKGKATIWPVSEDVFFHFPFVPHDVHLPLLYVAFMTFILIVSSVTMVLAVEAGHRMDRKGVTFWLGLTVIGGFIFLGSQVWEWKTFITGSDHGSYSLADNNIGQIVDYGHFKDNGDGTLTALPHDSGHDEGHAEEGDDTHENEGGGHGDHAEGDHGDGHGDGHAENHHKIDTALMIKVEVDSSNIEMYSTEDYKFVEGQPYIVLSPAASQALIATADYVKGANLEENEYGKSQYASFFFFITGFHGTHVFSGVILNLVILLNVIGGKYEKTGHYEMVEKVGLYWHFVDLVWVFVFTFFYLI